jgi:hypothetical protein
MCPFWRSNRSLAVAVGAAFLFLAWTAARAGDIDDKDFSLRFPAALSRFATYSDVAAVGGASAGSKWSSSINPASTAWLEDPPRKLSLCGQYSLLDFQNGSSFCVPAESVTVDTGAPGFFTAGSAQASTNTATLNNGLGFRFVSDIDELMWSKKLSDDWSVGSSLTYSYSLARNYVGDDEIAKSNCDAYTIRGGALHKITDHLLGGLVLDYGWSSDRTVIAPDARICDSTEQLLVRPGVSYEYMKDGTVYLDYQFGTFSNDTGRLNVYRIAGGIEHGFTSWLFARAGTTIDPSIGGSPAWTAGIGFYPAPWFSLDMGYQYNMFPEINGDFGRGQTFTISVAFTF